jgi:acryloyl-coenzyme A reductase
MRAIVQSCTGGPEVLELREVPEPEMRPTDVLIRVGTCGVCYHDVVVRNGTFRLNVDMPLITGHEVSGIVEKVGSLVRRFQPGDRVCTVQRRSVCGQCRECRSGHEAACRNQEFMGDAGLNGGYAELVAVSEDCVAHVPPSVDLTEAAIVACAVGTVLNAIRDVGQVKLGETVLITGANGGLGVHAIQIARASGAHVIAITSQEAKVPTLTALGAHEVVVTPHGTDFSSKVRALTDGEGVNVAIDCVGSSVFDSIRRSMARHGRWVLVGALSGEKVPFNPAQLFLNAISMLSAVSCSRHQLEDALTLVARGLVRPQIGSVLPLEKAAEAHAILEQQRPTGRIVLRPNIDNFSTENPL